MYVICYITFSDAVEVLRIMNGGVPRGDGRHILVVMMQDLQLIELVSVFFGQDRVEAGDRHLFAARVRCEVISC